MTVITAAHDHYRAINQSFGRKITVVRTKEVFRCHCVTAGGLKCEKTFWTSGALKKHRERIGGNDWLPCSDIAPPLSLDDDAPPPGDDASPSGEGAWGCPYCKTSYHNKSRSQHDRACHLLPFHTISQHYTPVDGTLGKPVTLTRENGKFRCRCVNPAGEICKEAFLTHGALQRHRRTAVGNDWSFVDAHSAVSSASSTSADVEQPLPELYDTSFGEGQRISQWGMMLNRRLRAFVCMECEAVVLPQHLKKHIAHKRLPRATAASTTHVDEVVAFAGLKVFHGCYGCPECGSVYQSRKACNRHAKQHAPLNLVPLEGVTMQRFSAAVGQKTGFQVRPPGQTSHQPQPDLDTYLRGLHDDDDASTTSQLPLDDKHVSPWHEFTGWPQFLEAGDRELRQLQALAAKPSKEDTLFYLDHAVRLYFRSAYELLPLSCRTARKVLMCGDPSKGNCHKVHFEKLTRETSFNAYSVVGIRLACYVVRDHASLRLPSPITGALEKIMAEHERGDDIGSHIHDLFLRLWSSRWMVKKNEPFPDPTIRFVMYDQINDDGNGLKGPKDVTGVLSKLQYLM
ncbi:hypothetical protein BD309DRAFT_1085135, partial [Dichomitus squalens]